MKYGYARVSTNAQNLNPQIELLKRYGVDRLIIEKNSGLSKNKKLYTLLKKLKENDTLVIWKLDRVSRSACELLNIVENLSNNNIKLVSISENLDTSTPLGKLAMQIAATFAELERNQISERTKLGLSYARKLGRIGGRPRIPEYKINEAIKLYTETTMSLDSIVEITNISKPTIYKYINAQNIGFRNKRDM